MNNQLKDENKQHFLQQIIKGKSPQQTVGNIIYFQGFQPKAIKSEQKTAIADYGSIEKLIQKEQK